VRIIYRGRSIRIIERKIFWQLDLDVIIFGPRIMEENVVFTLGGRKFRICTVFRQSGLQEQTFSGALLIAWNADLVFIDERLFGVENVFDRDVRYLGCAHLFLYTVF